MTDCADCGKELDDDGRDVEVECPYGGTNFAEFSESAVPARCDP